ncbi:MAG: hypothetical protein HYX68_12895 [Planctomycetes bacterium]|jgi:hypothetical protein|nr:hypothetical protein [Planctomycetota bacterium]
MSIFSKLTARPKGQPNANPLALERRARAAQDHLAELERQHGMAALTWAETGNSAELDRLDAEITAERKAVAALTAAVKAAQEKAAAEHAERQASMFASRLHAAAIYARRREKAVAKIQQGSELMGEGWRELLTSTDKMVAAAPAPMPAGAITSIAQLRHAVERELFRVSGEAGALNRGRALPGADPRDVGKIGDPNAMPKLADVIRDADEHALATLKGKQPAASAPVVVPAASQEAVEADERPVLVEPPEVDESALVPFQAPNLPTVKLTVE